MAVCQDRDSPASAFFFSHAEKEDFEIFHGVRLRVQAVHGLILEHLGLLIELEVAFIDVKNIAGAIVWNVNVPAIVYLKITARPTTPCSHFLRCHKGKALGQWCRAASFPLAQSQRARSHPEEAVLRQ